MGPHPEAPVDVQKYIGSCLITQQPRGKRKSGNRHADKDARCASYRRASTVSICTCCGGTQVNKLGSYHCLNNYAWTGIPLISVANARQKYEHRPVPRPLKPIERERLDYAGQSSESSESPSPSGNATAGFEEILSISQLAIHAQGVPLIISGDNEKSKDKDLRNDLEGYLFKGRDIFLGSSPPMYIMSNSKPAEVASPLYIPDDISISGESDLKSDTSSSQATSPSQSDCVSTTSEDSVTSENGLPRIIKPRKRRKKDRRNCEGDRDQPNECSGGAGIVTLKPYQPLCYRFAEPGCRKQNSYAKDFDSDIAVDYSCRKSAFPKVTHYPYPSSSLCCCPYCVPPPSTFLTPPHSPIESLLTESKKRERLCDVSKMIMFPGSRDVEIYSPNNIVSDDLINNFEDVCGFQTDPRTIILTSSHPPARPWIELSAKDPSSSCTFTIMCYNVLCDKYATPQMYGYCPDWALKWSYRKKRIMHEIRHYKADILSLQEVETEQFYSFFLPELQKDGYDGIFSPKSRAKTMSENERKHVDGCAIFYQTNKFSLLQDHLVEFNQLAMANAEGSDNMLNRVMTKDNIGLAALLQIKYGAYDKESEDSQMGQIFLVCTAHIHWDPEYSDVKLIQTMMLMQELHSIVDSTLRTNDNLKSRTSDPNDIPLLLCGDFNSLPDSGVIEFLSSGRVAKNHVDFKKFAYTDCLRNLFDSESNEFSHPFKIARAYNDNIMPFTNFSYDFKGTIDYVFYSKLHMSVVAVLGPLDPQWLEENNIHGCPHPHVPSDHFPILVELQLFPDPSLNPTISNGVNQHR